MVWCGLWAGLSRAQRADDPLQRHFEAAQTFQLVGNLDRAEAEYRQAIALGLHRMGNLRAAEGKLDEGIALLELAATAGGSSLDARVDLAIAVLRKGNLPRAAAEIENVLQKDPKNSRAQGVLGKIRFSQGDYRAAAGQLRAALEGQGDFEAAYLLGMAYLKQKKLMEATLLFDELLVALKPSPGLHILFGRAYRETEFYDQALTEFKKAIALDPKHVRAHYYAGLTQLLQGGSERFPEARQMFQKEIAINPDDYFSQFYLGVIELSERDFAAAEKNFAMAMRLQPENPDPYFFLGQVCAATGRPEQAAQALRNSIRYTKDIRHNNYQVARAHHLLGQSLQKLGRREEAQAQLKRSEELRGEALRLDQLRQQQADSPTTEKHADLAVLEQSRERAPVDLVIPELARNNEAREYSEKLADLLAAAYHNLGVIRARRNQFPEAAAHFQQAARWNPATEGLDRNWGVAWFRAGQFAEAIGPLERHLASNAGDAQARQFLALSYFAQEDYSKTVAVMRPVLDNLPEDPKLLMALATSMVRIGEAYNAGRLFTRLLERHADVAEVQMMAGQAHAAQGQSAEALARFRRALQIDPRVARAHYSCGLLLMRQGQLEESAAEFRSELELNSGDAAARYHLAYVLLLQQKTGEAVELFQQVVKQKPEYAEAHYQLGKIMLQRGQVREAIASLEAAVRLDPERDYSHFQLSQAYRRLGRSEEAERELQIYQQLKEKNRRTTNP